MPERDVLTRPNGSPGPRGSIMRLSYAIVFVSDMRRLCRSTRTLGFHCDSVPGITIRDDGRRWRIPAEFPSQPDDPVAPRWPL
jgi:hypothetical protein